MKALPVLYATVTLGALGASLAVAYASHTQGSAALPLWQKIVDPGPLSGAHASLVANCDACHAPHDGVSATRCIACHANDEGLLGKQTTTFHATIGDCRGCHVEHVGAEHRPVFMDHFALVRAKARLLSSSDRDGLSRRQVAHPYIQPEETALDCAACHANEDPHRALFGSNCSDCHGTSTWSIREFRHPSSLSMDCAQCHQAPPSHYMMHFQMVSMKVARVEHADVSQCFLCHKTNAWNDVKGVGWYKHH